MKKILPILLTSSLLAGAASGISPVDLAKLEELVKNDIDVRRETLEGGEIYTLSKYDEKEFIMYFFGDSSLTIFYKRKDTDLNRGLLFYDQNKDGKCDEFLISEDDKLYSVSISISRKNKGIHPVLKKLEKNKDKMYVFLLDKLRKQYKQKKDN
ncbi:MAG: hypothetical protein ISS82_01310 [Nanoarchaeota archaeon]|nr:hypothetical protein [Nanoarchaeota archaeon]